MAAYQAAVCTYQRLDALRSLQVKASDSHIGPRVWLCPLMTAVQYVNEEEVLPGLAHLFPTELDVIRGDAIAHLVVFVVPVGLLHDFARVVARAATDKWRYLFVALDCGTLPPSIACETMQQFAESQSFPWQAHAQCHPRRAPPLTAAMRSPATSWRRPSSRACSSTTRSSCEAPAACSRGRSCGRR